MLLTSLEFVVLIASSGLALIHAPQRTNADFLAAFLGRGLLVCVLLGFVRFFTHTPAVYLLAIVVTLAFYQMVFRRQLPFVEASSTLLAPVLVLGIYIVFLGIVAVIFFHNGMYEELLPRGAFMRWDGVVSFNRWAMEFYRFEYQPLPAYYPVGIPMVWSVLYDFQGNTGIWIFPLFLMFWLLLSPVLILGSFLGDRDWCIAALFCTAIMIVSIGSAYQMTNGGMDFPAALILFLGLFWTFLAFQNTPQICNERLFTGLSFLSVAAVIKQPGLSGLAIGVCIVLLLVFRRNLSWRIAIGFIGILLTPTALNVYLFWTTGESPVGNLDMLQRLAEEWRGNSVKSSFQNALSFSPAPITAALLGLGFWSVFRRGWFGLMSSVCLITVGLGFFAYHECCSYSARNAIWLYSYLCAAALPSIIFLRTNKRDHIVRRILTRRKASLAMVFFALAFTFLINASNAIYPLQNIETYFRDRLGGANLYRLLKENIEEIEKDSMLSFYKPLGFSTLVGHKHTLIERSTLTSTTVSIFNENGNKSPCQTNSTNQRCNLNQFLKDQPCALFLLLQTHDTHPIFGEKQLQIKSNFDLREVSTHNENHTLYRSGMTCSSW